MVGEPKYGYAYSQKVMLKGKFPTAEKCEEAVKKEKSSANGVTWGEDYCGRKCKVNLKSNRFGECYAVFNHDGKSDSSRYWKTCKFGNR